MSRKSQHFKKLVSTDRDISILIALDCRDPQAYKILITYYYVSFFSAASLWRQPLIQPLLELPIQANNNSSSNNNNSSNSNNNKHMQDTINSDLG